MKPTVKELQYYSICGPTIDQFIIVIKFVGLVVSLCVLLAYLIVQIDIRLHKNTWNNKWVPQSDTIAIENGIREYSKKTGCTLIRQSYFSAIGYCKNRTPIEIWFNPPLNF